MLGRKGGGLPDGKLLVIRIDTKEKKGDKEVPIVPARFSISHKVEDKWEKLPQAEQTISNINLFKLDLEEKEWEGDKYKIVKMYCRDEEANEIYLFDLRYTFLTRNLYNSLLSLEKFDNLSISLYKVKGKKDTNKDKEYSAISVWQNDSLVKGKFKNEELPKVEPIVTKSGVRKGTDTSELDQFFETELSELALKLEAAKQNADTPESTVAKTTSKKTQKPKEGDVEQEVEDKDIPF
jgi:hypothetical protein